MDYEDDDLDEIAFEFELLNSDDQKIITLVCTTDREILPEEYAEALRAFADRLDTIMTMAEASGGTIN
jgi:hypothetical protein